MSSNKVTVPYHLADLSTVHLELVYLVSCTHFGLLPGLTSDYFLPSLQTTSCTHFGLLPALTSDYFLHSLRTTSCPHFGLLPALTSDYVLPSLRTTSCTHFGLRPALTSDYFLHSLRTTSCPHFGLLPAPHFCMPASLTLCTVQQHSSLIQPSGVLTQAHCFLILSTSPLPFPSSSHPTPTCAVAERSTCRRPTSFLS